MWYVVDSDYAIGPLPSEESANEIKTEWDSLWKMMKDTTRDSMVTDTDLSGSELKKVGIDKKDMEEAIRAHMTSQEYKEKTNKEIDDMLSASITNLIKLANVLDEKGFYEEANIIDRLILAEEKGNDKKGFIVDIEKETVDNTDFRRVLYTGNYSQLVLMSIKPGEDIGEEVHPNVDQFFRVDAGSGKVIINGEEYKVGNGFAFVIPNGAKHNVINDSDEDLKLYSVYSPPDHEDKTIHKTKDIAEKATEHFDGIATEAAKYHTKQYKPKKYTPVTYKTKQPKRYIKR